MSTRWDIIINPQSRVKDSIEFVTETQELKQSIAALDVAIQREDWEAATRYMQRATTNVSPQVLNSGFAEAVVVSGPPLTPRHVPYQLADYRTSCLSCRGYSRRLIYLNRPQRH